MLEACWDGRLHVCVGGGITCWYASHYDHNSRSKVNIPKGNSRYKLSVNTT